LKILIADIYCLSAHVNDHQKNKYSLQRLIFIILKNWIHTLQSKKFHFW
jgi:hypothetical protein